MTAPITPVTPPTRSRTLTIGGTAGLLFGLIAAYLYSRSAKEELHQNGRTAQITTAEWIGLSLTLLGLARQISEMGRPKKKK
jgi:hypothetical protein